MYTEEIEFLCWLVPNRLAILVTNDTNVSEINSKKLVSSDLHQVKMALYGDFPPIDLGRIYKFCTLLSRHLQGGNQHVIYCVKNSMDYITNACFLLGSFMVLNLGISPEVTETKFQCISPYTRSFCDGMHSQNYLELPMKQCISCLAKVQGLNWLDLTNFDMLTYELLGDIVNGNIHQISPKFIVFKGPNHLAMESGNKDMDLSPSFYAKKLRSLGVSCVVRLNEPGSYDKDEFERSGIRSYGSPSTCRSILSPAVSASPFIPFDLAARI